MVKVSLDQFLTEEDFNPISGYVSMAFYYKHKPTYSIHIHFKPIQSQHWSHFLQCSLISVNLAWLKWCLSCSALFVFILKPSTWPHRSIDRVRERPQSQHQPATSETHFHWVTESYRRNCNTFFLAADWSSRQNIRVQTFVTVDQKFTNNGGQRWNTASRRGQKINRTPEQPFSYVSTLRHVIKMKRVYTAADRRGAPPCLSAAALFLFLATHRVWSSHAIDTGNQPGLTKWVMNNTSASFHVLFIFSFLVSSDSVHVKIFSCYFNVNVIKKKCQVI